MTASTRTTVKLRRNAEGLSDALLMAAVFIGQASNRPMTAYKLAQECGIPRPTVVRKLRELVAIGLVDLTDGKATIAARVLASKEFTDNINDLAQLVHRASAQLSKMDTPTIALVNVKN